jgi:hypothetical protein
MPRLKPGWGWRDARSVVALKFCNEYPGPFWIVLVLVPGDQMSIAARAQLILQLRRSETFWHCKRHIPLLRS